MKAFRVTGFRVESSGFEGISHAGAWLLVQQNQMKVCGAYGPLTKFP